MGGKGRGGGPHFKFQVIGGALIRKGRLLEEGGKLIQGFMVSEISLGKCFRE